MEKRLGTYLDQNVYRLFRATVARRDCSISFAVEEALIDWIRKEGWEEEPNHADLEALL